MSDPFKRIGAVVGMLFLISILDGFVSGHLESKDIYRTLPGGSEWASGTLSVRIPSIESLAFSSQSPYITMEFVETQGNMWRGMVHVAQDTKEGEYRFRVHMKGEPIGEKIPQYRILVFNDESSYRSSFHSLFRKYLGISPWWVTASSIPFLVLCFGISFRASAREETALNRDGLATIFKVTRRDDIRQISFGLGRQDGVDVGDTVLVLDKSLKLVGEAKVSTAGDRHATAAVGAGIHVQPDFLVETRKSRRSSSAN